MMENMSPADIKAVTGNDGEGWGGGAWWIIILFLFVFMGGGFWGNRNSDFGQYATAASQQEILFGQQFGQINDRLTNLGNGICNLGFEMQGNIGQLGKEVALGQSGLGQRIDNNRYEISRQLSEGFCGVNANIEAKFAALEKGRMEERISQLEQANNQLFIKEQLGGVVRYPSGYSYNAGPSPFCGGNSGCCAG